MNRTNKGWIRWVPTAILAVGFLVLLINRQAVADWVRMYGYEPTAAVSQLAIDTTMTDEARHLFYLNRPSVDPKAEFAKNCPNRREQSVVIGCYHSVQRGIHVLKVDDSRLEGVEEVTAAHEMLHAAYDRLSGSERSRIDGLLNDYAGSGLQHERIKNSLDAYEADERTNEMHSMFGTEIAELPPELERYYARYFGDRQQVTSAAARYAEAFTSLEEQVKAYDAQLEAWKQQIDDSTTQIESAKTDLDRRKSQLDEYERAGQVAAYNAAVGPYNGRVDAYNRAAAELRDLISRYNQLVAQRNAVAIEENDLHEQLDSGVHATPAQ